LSLILTRDDIGEVVATEDAVRAVEEAFLAYGQGRVNMPPKTYLYLPKGDFRAMYGEVELNGHWVCGLKWVNVHPDNPARGLPTVMAKILLNDPETGIELADLEGTLITDLRTGAAGAVAAKYMARPGPAAVGLVGSGVQAWYQLAALRLVRQIRQVRAWSLRRHNAEVFAARARAELGLAVEVVDSAEEAVRGQDIVVTTTPSRRPIVQAEWMAPGTHINAIGADAPGKQELDPSLLAGSRVIVDDLVQALHSGEINVAVTDGRFTKGAVAASLGEVVAGLKPGRTSPEQVTIFDSTGLIIQDLALADLAFRLCRERGLGREVDFGSARPNGPTGAGR
jgi:alanine dehydrogenase